MAIEARSVTKRFGEFVALDDVSIAVASGGLVALLGPSGSGKSTLLRVIAGLERPDSGAVLINGEDATFVPPQRRGVGFVFQHYAPFKHMTVWDNVAFGLAVGNGPNDENPVGKRGRIEQTGTPRELYEEPANEFVMTFVGPATRLDGQIVRPHDLEILPDPGPGAVEAQIERIVHLGFEVRLELVLGDGERLTAQVTRDQVERDELAAGQIVSVRHPGVGVVGQRQD